MGGRQSTPGSAAQSPLGRSSMSNGHHSAPGTNALSGPGSSRDNSTSRSSRQLMVQSDWRTRARSMGNFVGGHPEPSGRAIVNLNGMGFSFGVPGSPDSDTSTEDISSVGRVFSPHSLPLHFMSFSGIKCPVCSKPVPSDDVECHLVMCLTKPRISYNEDILTDDKGDECVICLEDLSQGDTIARLPCLCIYHKNCIDSWFEVNRSCPEHPAD
ncbi:E3 ubiquitin-protein ligase ZNRF1 [Halotydeus destructor]|nr:E3 ubiquitin-protein ligase ZNRF1 [Halotydeus destructor]